MTPSSPQPDTASDPLECLSESEKWTVHRFDKWEPGNHLSKDMRADLVAIICRLCERLSRSRECQGCPTVECSCMSELETELLAKLAERDRRIAEAVKEMRREAEAYRLDDQWVDARLWRDLATRLEGPVSK